MQKRYVLLSVLILGMLSTGCAARAEAQAQEAKGLSNDQGPAILQEQPASAQPQTKEIISKESRADCPLTVPQEPPFIPPAPYSELGLQDGFWYGSEHLWTHLWTGGVWAGLPRNPEGYTQKIFWWSEFFSFKDEPEPELTVFGERLDTEAPPLKASKATNASAGDIGTAMLVGVDFPTPGCWRVTGQHKKSELSFVVWVAP